MGKTVLVLGANGRLGRAVVTAFSQAGWIVLAHARKPLKDFTCPIVIHINFPLDQVADIVDAMGGADVVVNALNPLYTEWNREAISLAKTATLISLSLRATLIFPGNIYNFGQQMPTHLDEATPQHPTTAKGKIRQTIEADIEQETKNGLQGIIVRAGDYIGEWNSGTWMDMAILKDLAKGRITYLGDMETPHSWAYIPDVAKTLVKLAEMRQKLPNYSVYHFPGYTLTGNQLLTTLTRVTQKVQLIPAHGELAVRRFPWPIIRFGGFFIPLWRELYKMRYLWDTPHQLCGEKLQKTLGTIPHTPLNNALETLLISAGFSTTTNASKNI